MKIKVLHHAAEQQKKDAVSAENGVSRIQRNLDPALHPFAREREYQRAMVGVKLQKLFAKPFVTALDGHFDAIRVLRRSNAAPMRLYSGACDGEVILWDLGFSKVQTRWKAHTGFVRGIVEEPGISTSNSLFTCGDDKCIHWWDLSSLGTSALQDEDQYAASKTNSGYANSSKGNVMQLGGPSGAGASSSTIGGGATTGSSSSCDSTSITPRHTWRAASAITSLDHHWSKPLLVSTGDTVDLWDRNRSQPISSIEWGCDQVYVAKFNPAEPCLIAATAADNSISLYDLRQTTQNSAIRKVLLKNRSNALCWNPQEPQYFTVANENGNLYTFDMRKLSNAVTVHAGHVMPVLDVDYAPNGQEFVSASYDRTVRLWSLRAQGSYTNSGQQARDTYHGKRMQRVLACQFSTDGRFVFSGSEDHNVRVWKSRAAEKLGGVSSDREAKARYYRERLVEKYSATREVSRIAKQSHLPKTIRTMAAKQKIMKDAKKRKDQNRKAHSKPGTTFENTFEKQKMLRHEEA
ncbi:unnamed protein product [Amoebophrya sp. A25]|nr:unnamed protein product [Amoebophrya sp. A25]|eukprot:GSA25T00004106001.1